jgi:transcriptional regulator GlxA family with amidase domain
MAIAATPIAGHHGSVPERPNKSSRPLRRVVLVAFDGVQSLDLTGPAEVFSIADRLGGDAGYSIEVVSASGEPVRSSSGIALGCDRSLRACRGPIDTLLVAGGMGVPDAERDEALRGWLRGAAARSRRVASVCTGAFLLARAGLLDGRAATTHWSACETLARRHPTLRVDADRIFVRDGDVWTSAGVTAGIDLALALVEGDLGRERALEVARWLVVFSKRPGGQAQFSASLDLQRASGGRLGPVQDLILSNVGDNLTVEALAEHAGMSGRSFSRAFRREMGLTPAAYVEAVRVERARLALESTNAPVDAIARDCGFGTPETMRRAFARRLRVGPAEYRGRFGATLEQRPQEAHA